MTLLEYARRWDFVPSPFRPTESLGQPLLERVQRRRPCRDIPLSALSSGVNLMVPSRSVGFICSVLASVSRIPLSPVSSAKRSTTAASTPSDELGLIWTAYDMSLSKSPLDKDSSSLEMESRLDTDPQEETAWYVCWSRFSKKRRLVKSAVALLGGDRPRLIIGTGGGGGPSGGVIAEEKVQQV